MRELFDLREGWLFSRSCTAAPAALPAGDGWEPVTLPHTWNAVDGHDGSPYDRGAYWYATAFTAPQQPLPGGRVYVEVGAAGLVGEIWVNGRFVTRHVGGYSAFRADVTDFCRPGENVLAICCDNRYSDHVYPQQADFTFYGGLYRYVHLISAPPSRFTLDDHGGSGVYIDAEPAGDGSAAVTLRARLDGAAPRQTVGVEILDAAGQTVAESWAFAGPEVTLTASIPAVWRWNGTEDPYLYTARLRLLSYNEVVDELRIPFGVRNFSIDRERGFLLNGASHPLRGVCRHQDRLYEGNALTRDEHFEDAQIIADMGANCIRLAHYQQSHDIYDACDQLGLVVWAEIPYFAHTWDDEAHAAAVNEIREMVIQNYNHPSICFWGLSNEILMGGNDNPKLMPCHQELAAAVKAIDARRLTVIAHEYTHAWDHPLHGVSDAEGWNHYFGWYRGEVDGLADWCDRYHAAYPERLVAISEYGCDAILSYHTDEPVKMDYTEEYQVRLHENACETFAARPWIWGSFVWNMFDFGSSFRREGGTRGRNNKGLVTMDRKIKKDAYYVYKAWFSPEPFVHIDGRRYFERPGETATIRVHSNQPEVRLFVDGRAFAAQSSEHVFVFENVPLSRTGTVLTARAGDCADTITLRSVETAPAAFTFPAFKESRDAQNWYNSIELAVGNLEAQPGRFSVHDTVGAVLANPAAKKVLQDCLTAAVGRPMPWERFLSGEAEKLTVAELLSAGMLSTLLGEGRETAIRRAHTALSQIEK